MSLSLRKDVQSLCYPIEEGGLGFRKARIFNDALVAKITWMVASGRDSLCIKALCSKYKVKEDWLGKDPKTNASPLWKAIENLKGVIAKGACYLVGDGTSIDMWKDPWVPWLVGFRPTPYDPSSQNLPMVVSLLIDQVTKSWNVDLLETLVDPLSLTAILRIPIPIIPQPNRLIWSLDPKGMFSMSSAVKLLNPASPSHHSDPKWLSLWSLELHERLKVFMWRLGSNSLLTKVNVAHRVGSGDTSCSLCGSVEESYSHLFLHCNMVRPLWFGLCWGLHPEHLPAVSGLDFLKLVTNPPICPGPNVKVKILKAKSSIHFAFVLDSIWNIHNQVAHNGTKINMVVEVNKLEKWIVKHFQTLKIDKGKTPSTSPTWKVPPPPPPP
jgi:hypothetical protein